jgi:hypothetical protein
MLSWEEEFGLDTKMSKGHFDFYEEVDKFEKKRRSSYED